MNENEEKIYDLIGSKSFSELTEEEKALALESLGSGELYEKMREANLAAEEALSDDLAPPADMKSTVMAAFDEKDEKRGVVWWKYAAAVAVLVVGVFVFWPSANLEREPIAENAVRKDSAKLKKEESPVKTKKTEEATVENEQQEEDPESKSENPEPPTITSSEYAEVTDEMIVAEIDGTATEDESALADEAADSYSITEADDQENLTINHDGIDNIEEEEISAAPEVAQKFSSSDKASIRKDDDVTSNTNITMARSAARMNSDVNAQNVFPKGISLESIGGPSRNNYVAY